MKRSIMKPSSVALKRTGFARADRIEAREVSKLQRATEPKPAPGPRQRKCAVKTCRKLFMPERPFIIWCCAECGAAVALDRVAKQKAKEAKAERAKDKQKLEAFKPLRYWEVLAERACNAFIRARDPDICISCGVTYSVAWQAGHYISVGANPTIRYHQDNINKQCIHCNLHLASNATQYRIGLVAKIGLERVEWLEGWHPTVKMTADYAKEIAATYRAKLKELKR